MINIINTGKFLLRHQLNRNPPVKSFQYRDQNLNQDFKVFSPAVDKARSKKIRKVILVFHGMTMLGSSDPKLAGLCKALAGCGYNVLVPQIDSMQNLQIEISEVENIVRMIFRLSENPEICPEGRLSIFSASFAGGLCLMASADERISKRVSSVCLVGSFGDIESSIDYLLRNQLSDDYGRLIILKNFLKYSIDLPEDIYRAFDIALSDNFTKREEPKLPAYLAHLIKVSLKNYDITVRLLTDPCFRLFHWERIKRNKEFENILNEFSMKNYLDKISAPVLLIHGAHDNVIPPQESMNLFKYLRKMKVKSKLIITPLMSHSDLKFNINVLPSIIDLAKGLSSFFGSI